MIRALKTTTQLALPALSISVSAIWGTFTLVSWVAWIRSEKHKGKMEQEVSSWILARDKSSTGTDCAESLFILGGNGNSNCYTERREMDEK